MEKRHHDTAYKIYTICTEVSNKDLAMEYVAI